MYKLATFAAGGASKAREIDARIAYIEYQIPFREWNNFLRSDNVTIYYPNLYRKKSIKFQRK